MKLYAITKGEYSDYRIISLTTDKEKAIKIAKLFDEGYEETQIEEYEDGEYDKFLDCKYACHFFRIGKDGKVIEWEKRDSFEFALTFSKVNTDSGGNYWLYVIVPAREGKIKALKIAFDKIAQYKAEKEGL